MMDMLYQRYACPFDYLDTLLELGRLYDGIKGTLYKDNDDKLWQLYLHSMPTKSFNEWKESMANKQANSKGLTQTEMGSIINKSNSILKSFSPKKGV